MGWDIKINTKLLLTVKKGQKNLLSNYPKPVGPQIRIC